MDPVESFVPFDQLLPHADVLVTNGGYGGVQAVLSDPSYKERVQAMRQAYARYDSLALIVSMVSSAP